MNYRGRDWRKENTLSIGIKSVKLIINKKSRLDMDFFFFEEKNA